MKTHKIAASMLLALSGLASASRGETNDLAADKLADLSLAELMQIEIPTVVAASKYEQKVTEAPSAVTIITADDIRKYGYRTMADILRSVRGFYVTYDRGYHYVGVRGFNRPGDFGGRILLMVNGHRLNDPLYDTVATGYDFLLDVDLIERVEVVRGPGSSLYGDNALFGVINVITRRGRDFKGAEVSASAGSQNTYQGRATYGAQLSNGVEWVVSGSVLDSRGADRLHIKDPDHDGIVRHMDETQNGTLFLDVSYRDWSLRGGYVRRDKQIPTATYGAVFGSDQLRPVDERAYTELVFDHAWGDGWRVLARGYADRYCYESSYPYDYANPGDPPDIVLNRDENMAEWAGGEVQLSKRIGDRLTLTGGSEYRNDYRVRLRNFDVDPAATYQDTTISRDSYAFYAQGEWRVLTNLILNAGGRYDIYESFGDTAHPRAALIYNPWSQTTLKFLYGSAFRAPNAVENYYQDGISSIASPNVQPEEVTTYEVVAEQGLGRHWRASVAAFQNDAEDLIQGTAETPYQYANISSVQARGLEFELQGQWENGLRGVASYALTDTEDRETGRHLDNSPEHLAKLNLIVPLWRDRVFAGGELQYTGPRTTVGGYEVDDFVVANLTLYAQKLRGGWEASASVYNLFDTRYRDPASGNDSVEQDGRTMRVKLTYRF